MGNGHRRDTGKRTTAAWTVADTPSIVLRTDNGSGKTDKYTFINFPARNRERAAQNQYTYENDILQDTTIVALQANAK
jgi:hypothetical protein